MVLLNKAIIDWHKNLWEDIIERPITTPEFNPGWCRTKRCTNAAIIYSFCTDCTRRKYRVEVKQSTLHTTNNRVGVGLFALKLFKSGEYICDFSWNIFPDNDGIPRSKKLTLVEPGPYVLTIIVNGEEWKGDAGSMMEGKLKGAGLARYVQDGKQGRANGTFVRKDGRVNTWGVAVKEGKDIKKGAEIFVDYGIHYTWDDTIE
jgi:hypothetical protein